MSDNLGLPKKGMVIAAIVKIDKREDRGVIIGCFKNGPFNIYSGWGLGYNKVHFVFKIAIKYTGAPPELFELKS